MTSRLSGQILSMESFIINLSSYKSGTKDETSQ